METEARRSQLVSLLRDTETPVTGSSLAKEFGVSRQVIVTDIAILRAEGNDILATPQGYVIAPNSQTSLTRTLAVKHDSDLQVIERELHLIVDHGAKVRDVIIEHPIYGEIRGLLMVKSRRDVQEFLNKMRANEAEPLLVLTEGVHLHTLEAEDPQILEEIEQELRKAGFSLLG